jgi:hypothetical protein
VLVRLARIAAVLPPRGLPTKRLFFLLWKDFHNRKNWIHIGSQQAGPGVAAILSVVENCRQLGIPVREYLHEILPGLANMSIQLVADLTPTAWAARHTHANL